jgi:hypothetical protein
MIFLIRYTFIKTWDTIPPSKGARGMLKSKKHQHNILKIIILIKSYTLSINNFTHPNNL